MEKEQDICSNPETPETPESPETAKNEATARQFMCVTKSDDDDKYNTDDDDENDNDENDDDYDDEEDDGGEDKEDVTCLFCSTSMQGKKMAFKHLKDKHNIDFRVLQKKFLMDQYSFLKMINYIRSKNITPEQLMSYEKPVWESNEFLKPKDYEPWLTYDYEYLVDAKSMELELNELKRLFKEKVEQVELDKIRMRAVLLRMMQTMPASTVENLGKANEENTVASTSLAKDDGYFNSYAHFSIHHEMLSDKVRTLSYRSALLENKDFVKDKIVLDVGCGTGILSIFAAQAGASQVLAIDNSDIIYQAMEIINKQELKNISTVKGRLEDTAIDIEKFDIIISEWMGYFLLFEGMLDSVIYARERHLKPDGMMLPNRCNISLCGFGDDELFEKHVTFWNDVYGIDMSNLGKKVLLEPLLDIVNPGHILTEAEIIADFDMMTVDLNYSNFTYEFNLKCIKDGKLSAFLGYFDTFFDLPNPVSFSTGPKATPTHWKQCVFFLENPVLVKNGDIISGTFKCRRSRSNARSLDIMIQTNDQTYKYYFD